MLSVSPSMHLQIYSKTILMKYSLCFDATKLFCLQCRASTYYPYLVHLDTFRPTALRPKQCCLQDRSIFPLTACEQYSLRTDHWTPIADYPFAASGISIVETKLIQWQRKQMCVYSSIQLN